MPSAGCATASGSTSRNRREAPMTAATLRRLIVIGLIALWEILPRAGLIPELFLPSLSSTLIAGWSEAAEYGHALVVTLYEVAISMAFACGGRVLFCGGSRKPDRAPIPRTATGCRPFH